MPWRAPTEGVAQCLDGVKGVYVKDAGRLVPKGVALAPTAARPRSSRRGKT